MSTHNTHFTDYQVIEADGVEDLAQAVMHAIRNRWQPYGDMAAVQTKDGVRLFQPMIQHAEWYA